MRTAKKKIGILDEGVLLTDDVDSIDFTGTGITGTVINKDVTEALNSGTTAAGWTTDGSTKTTTPYKVGIGSSAASPRGIVDVLDTTSPLLPPSSLVVDFNEGTEAPSGNYVAGGSNFAFRVYSYRTVDGVKQISSTYFENGDSDPNDSNPMTIDPSWSAVAGATGYRVFFSDPYYLGTDFAGNWSYVDTTATTLHFGGTTTFQEDNMTGSAEDITPVATYPDFYIDSTTGSAYLNGNLTADSFIRTGGTSAQFLKADGSIDSSTYLSSASAASTYVPYTGATTNVALGTRTLAAASLFAGDSPSAAYQISLRKSTGNAQAGITSVVETGYGGLFFGSGDFARYFQIVSWGTSSGGPGRFGVTNNTNEILSVNATNFVIGTFSTNQMILGTSNTARMTFGGGGTVTMGTTLAMGDQNISTGTTTGTKFGTATSQKIGFFNATPIVQVVATTEIGVALSNLGLRAAGTAYPITTSGAITLGSLTSTRVPIAGTAGLLGDDADLTFTGGDTLNATKLVSSTSVSTPLMISTGVVRLKNYTVATLPAGTQGDKAFVTDALGPTYLVTVVGGGAVITEVFYNGTNWVCT